MVCKVCRQAVCITASTSSYLTSFLCRLLLTVVAFDILSDDYSKVRHFRLSLYCHLFFKINLLSFCVVGVFALWPLCRIPLPKRTLLQDTDSKVWKRLFIPLSILWPFLCRHRVRVDFYTNLFLLHIFTWLCDTVFISALRCTDWIWNKDASSTHFRLMQCKSKAMFYDRVIGMSIKSKRSPKIMASVWAIVSCFDIFLNY